MYVCVGRISKKKEKFLKHEGRYTKVKKTTSSFVISFGHESFRLLELPQVLNEGI